MGVIEPVLLERPTRAGTSFTSGSSYPVGATVLPGRVNFSIFSRGASDIDLLLFDRANDARPARLIRIDPADNRTYHYWHTFVVGIGPGQIYGLRVHGPYDPATGCRFDPMKVLLDPYGRAVVVPRDYSRVAAASKGDNTPTAMKSVVVDSSAYDWVSRLGFRPPARSYTRCTCAALLKTLIHVTERARGTFGGLIEKLPYLIDLGITAVRTTSHFRVRCPGLSAWARELSGICSGFVFCTTPWV
jgi:glycogen operon protein